MALSRRTVPLTAALAVVGLLVLAGSAFGADQRVVKTQDDCDAATFNAALGPGACVGSGKTTFQDLLAQFAATGSVDKWQFSRPDFNIDAGGTITVVDEGGEAHTFTRVAFFGNGCSPLDNGEPVAGGIDCATFDPRREHRVPGRAPAHRGRPRARDRRQVPVHDPSVDALDRGRPREGKPRRPRLRANGARRLGTPGGRVR